MGERPRRRELWKIAAIVVSHMALVSWALRLSVPPAPISLMWMPDGFLVGCLVVLGNRRSWPLLLGALALSTMGVELTLTDRAPALIASFTLANLGEAALGALVVQRFCGGREGFSELSHLSAFIGIVVFILPGLSAVIATLGILSFGDAPPWWPFFRTWWSSTGLGVLFIAPVVMYGLQAKLRRRPPGRLGSPREHLAILLVTTVVAALASLPTRLFDVPLSLALFITLPVLVWGAIRLGIWGTITVAATLAVTLVHLVAFGPSTSPDGTSTAKALLQLQGFLGSAVIASLFTALALEKYRHAVAISEDRLRRHHAMFNHAPVSLWEEDFSLVKAHLDANVEGDLADWFAEHPEEIPRCAQLVRVVAVNSKTLELFEAESQSALLDNLDALFLEASLPAFGQELVTFYEGGQTFHGQAPQRTLKGRIIETSTNVTLAPGAEGDWHRVLVAIEDVTAVRRNEQALRRSQKMDALGQMVGGVAHDFNNILGVVLGGLELLDDEPGLTPEMRLQHRSIRKAGLRAKGLTQQLLRFSRGQATEVTVLDLSDTVRSMRDLVTRSVTPAIEVQHQLQDELWMVEIDGGEFQDALLNLVINARDAMPEGGQLTIRTRNRRLAYGELSALPAGEYVEVSVEDTGQGMSAEVQERLFEPFFSTKPKGKGTGLGLATLYGFVQRSRGHVEVTSSPGEGARFDVVIPRTAKAVTPAEPLAAPKVKIVAGQGTILVVDDELQLRQLAERMLRRLGYDVLTAADGKQALRALEANPQVDLLFSDVVMPGGVDGYELATRAQAMKPSLQILLTSGFTNADPDELPGEDAPPLIDKPYRLADLAERIRCLLATNQASGPSEVSLRGLQWSDAHALGDPMIDADHRHLFELLDQATRSVTGPGPFESVLEGMLEFCRDHFAREEALMVDVGYPDLTPHRESHCALVAQVERMVADDIAGVELCEFLHRWITEHLEREDRALGRFLERHRRC